jgi:hypothetical protein
VEVEGAPAPNNWGVPDTAHNDNPEQSTCHYHPGQPAFVRCGRCGKPLCPECVQHGPVGTRCVECLLGIVIRPVTRARRVAASAAAAATALALGAGLGYFGLLNWLTGIALGLAVAQTARSITHRVAAPGVQAAAGCAAAVGVYWGAVVARMTLLVRLGAPGGAMLGAIGGVSLWQWVLPGLLAAGAAIYWMRRP